MRTDKEYAALIPTVPPDDLVCYLQDKEGFFRHRHMSYKAISKEEAAARAWDEDLYADLRESRNDRAALLWCSNCEREIIAQYVPAKKRTVGVCTAIERSGIRMPVWGSDELITCEDGCEIECPCCGAGLILRSASSLSRYGRCEQHFVVVPSVADGCLVLTTWCVERRQMVGREETYETAFNAYVFDGEEKRFVRLDAFRKGMNGAWFALGGWKRLKRFADKMGAPIFYDGTAGRPDLRGTALENAKLWEYMDTCYEDNGFYPVAYLRLYAKHPTVENLITAGFAPLVAEGMGDSARVTYYYSNTLEYGIPKLNWVNWKEKRPAQMLGLNKQQAHVWREKQYDLKALKTWHTYRHKIDFGTLCKVLDSEIGRNDIGNILADGMPPVRTVNYLEKQNRRYYYYMDYCRMAAQSGMDMAQEENRWPKDLRAAHDRAMEASRYAAADCGKYAEQFREMSARCAALAWEHDGICIRPAMEPSELVREGDVLHHCVGGYAQNHADGNIILFVRHSRRPERSWYTLNINVKTHKEIQLHGYRNEMGENGARLKIPQRVRDFVDLWRREVLDKWRLPPAPADAGKKKKQKVA